MAPGKLIAAVLLLGMLLPGCATWYDVAYVPAPLEVKLEDAATPALSGRALISVVGLRRASSKNGTPAQFEIAMRLENLGTLPFVVEADSLELVTANLTPVGKAVTDPQTPDPIAPGTTGNLNVVFPLAPQQKLGDLDLSGLNLRWALAYEGRRMVMGASFQRAVSRYPYYYGYGYGYYDDPYYWPGWHCRVGVHVGHFHAY